MLSARYSSWFLVRSILTMGPIAVFIAAASLLPDRNGHLSKFYQYFSFSAAGLLLLVLVALAWQFVATRGDVFVVSSAGLKDVRLAREMIPWAAIRNLRVVTTGLYSESNVLQIDLEPEWSSNIHLTKMARFQIGSNRPFGINGLRTSLSNLTVSEDVLLSALRAQWAALGRPLSDRISEPTDD